MLASLNLTIDEVITAALLALAVTWLIKIFRKLKNFFSEIPDDIGYKNEELSKLLDSCYRLFPIQRIPFKDKVFTRGSIVRIITMQNKSFEGEIIGLNKDNMVCIKTNSHIMAHNMANILDIILINE